MMRKLFAGIVCAMAFFSVSVSGQEIFPSKPIKLVLPYAPGGPTDAIARAMAKHMEMSLKVPVIVENKPGAQGGIAMQTVGSSKGDGYTIGLAPGNVFTTNRILLKNLPYKVEDFKLLTTLYRGGVLLAVPKNSPASTLKQFIELSKSESRPLIFGTAGPGGTSHLTMEQLAQIEGLKTQMVSYRGDSPMVVDVLGGTLPAAMVTVSVTIDHYKRGALKVLAITSDRRMSQYPDIPTFKESGYPDIESYFWAGTVVPAGTPDAIADLLRKAIVTAMHSDEVKATFTPDIVPFTGGVKDFNDFIAMDMSKWSDLIQKRGITIQ